MQQKGAHSVCCRVYHFISIKIITLSPGQVNVSLAHGYLHMEINFQYKYPECSSFQLTYPCCFIIMLFKQAARGKSADFPIIVHRIKKIRSGCSRVTDRETVQKDIGSLYLGNLETVAFDLRLPGRGKNGSRISWRSDNPAFLDHLGRVTRPAYGRGNQTVTLTARFVCGAWAEERQYPVTVLEEGGGIEVEEILSITVEAARGEPVHLPCAAAVRTRDGRTLARFLEWDGGLTRVWEQAGTYEVQGRLKDTQIPAVCRIQVGEISREEPQRPIVPAESLENCVALLPGSAFYDAQERMHEYLLRTDPDQWLYNFRQAAGLDLRGAEPMSGWDAPEGLLRGHSTGHYLSALALCWRATKDEAILRRAQYMADALGECQAAFSGREGYHPGFLSAYSEEQFDLLEQYTPYPRIWAPYYTLHKLLAGLLELYRLAGIRRALEIAEGIGGWIYTRLSRLSHERRVKMWGLYIAGEYGGMNEALARLYLLTGKEKYLTAARWFDNDRLFVPLRQGVDALEGMHANQHIPQVVGAMRLYEAAGERRYYEIAERFWQETVGSHMYAIGGVGEGEMFHRPGKIAGLLTRQTAESCATYNMLKLTKELFRYRPDEAYMDYCERAVFNHTLSCCDHRPTGGSTYFLPLVPGAVKEFDVSDNSCCHGTGLESAFQYGDNIYYRGPKGIYVNLLIPSRLRCPETGVMLTLETAPARPQAARISLEAEVGGRGSCTLLFRKPRWTKGAALVDGRPSPAGDGYVTVRREWTGRCTLEIEFPCTLRYEPSPDRPELFTVHYGPWLLAALSERTDRLRLHTGKPETDFVPVEDEPLTFLCVENGVRFVPLAQIWREPYQVYLQKA